MWKLIVWATGQLLGFQDCCGDNHGNVTRGYTPEGYVLTMTYDAENRLKTAEYTDGSSIMHRAEYYYGGDSLLAEMKKFENGVRVSDTRYVRTAFLPVQERDGNNTVTREYTWGLDSGGGIGGLLNLKQGGADYSYLYNGQANVTALLDSNQSVVSTYTYDPFGILMNRTGSINQPYMFSTKEYDPETGLSYYGYRFYNPSIGKWVTRDPFGEAGGVNVYGFTLNNPVNWIDPFGLIVLPPNPSGLPCCWQFDPSHKDPYGQRYRHPSGDILDFNIGRPWKTGYKAIDHWHFNEGEEHLLPGREIPGGECDESEDKRSLRQKVSDAWENLQDFLKRITPKKPTMPFPLPLPMPGPIPIPIP